MIKCVRNGVLPETFLGKPLTPKLQEEMRWLGVDPCGENGEYHTVVVDGPLFRHPVEVQNRGILRLEHISAVEPLNQKMGWPAAALSEWMDALFQTEILFPVTTPSSAFCTLGWCWCFPCSSCTR